MSKLKINRLTIILAIIIIPILVIFANNYENKNKFKKDSIMQDNHKLEKATFGAGCFWCVEAVFEKLNGVESVISGYTGGNKPNPTYKEVCTGETGHAEVSQITYDPNIITYTELLEVFWKTHDPTTINRQGNDIGTQYRSAIFYHNQEQKQIAELYKKRLEEEKSI